MRTINKLFEDAAHGYTATIIKIVSDLKKNTHTTELIEVIKTDHLGILRVITTKQPNWNGCPGTMTFSIIKNHLHQAPVNNNLMRCKNYLKHSYKNYSIVYICW